MKKIINTPETLVSEMLNGIALAHPEVEYLQKYNVIKRKEINPDKVTLISGGGSGHEPAHAGFVGKGMLDAAVAGDIFASPSQIQIYQAIRATASKKGTLLIIKNYSGDVMHFGSAAAMAGDDGIQVDMVKVDDDIAVRDSLYTVGRRGVAGTVLVHKITGAAAERGLSLPEVKAVAQHVIDNVRTIGFALSSCVVPASGVPTFDIGEDEMEYGVGIHGEPGCSREKVASADELAKRTVTQLAEELALKPGSEVTLLINGFGGTPLQELYVMNNAVSRELDAMGIQVYRRFVGNYMTSIDMLGGSVTLLKMDDELKSYLDDPCMAAGFHVDGPEARVAYTPLLSAKEAPVPETMRCEDSWLNVSGGVITLDNIKAMLKLMSDCIIENEVPFCKLDSYAGDGDFGMSVAKGFRQLKCEWEEILANDGATIGDLLMGCSLIIAEYCGGASGAIWGAAFRAARLYAGERTALTPDEFAAMMQAAVAGIQRTGERSFGRGAVVGDKTLIDALVPCADALTAGAKAGMSIRELLAAGARAAVDGAAATANIVARMGRAGVVGERSLGHPDAGAYALGVIFTEVSQKLRYE